MEVLFLWPMFVDRLSLPPITPLSSNIDIDIVCMLHTWTIWLVLWIHLNIGTGVSRWC